ncbi:MAG: hypothetical protein CFH33_01349 [Alphaproteobacteria bacterium MarineAlpha9_Bin3]|nr:MAG: hypothetical protein CFH33_01349 [Alphaproteobacteria bacterium MarineAlpha9_Bin3]|tara:strand:+ start:3297 stop:3527 length:231 start_codon:yes stop_codon:yes gene_type:complete
MPNSFYVLNVIVLSVLLYYPVNKLIFVLSVRRLEKKIGKKLNNFQKSGQLRRSRFISIFLIIIFSCLFNINILDIK